MNKIEQRANLIIKEVKLNAKDRFERGEFANPYGESRDKCIGTLQMGMFDVYEKEMKRLRRRKCE